MAIELRKQGCEAGPDPMSNEPTRYEMRVKVEISKGAYSTVRAITEAGAPLREPANCHVVGETTHTWVYEVWWMEDDEPDCRLEEQQLGPPTVDAIAVNR